MDVSASFAHFQRPAKACCGPAQPASGPASMARRMIDVILNFARTRPHATFWLFVAVHGALWTLLPALAYTSPPIDVVEGLAWGHEWQLGYVKHPPLPAWLLEAAYQATGGVWGAYLLSQLSIAATLVAVWTFARPMVGEFGALLAAVALEGVFYFTVPTPEFNNNVLQMPLWAWASVHFHRALMRHAARYWLCLAVEVAALVYTKYSGGLLVLVFALIAVATVPGRAALKSRWPYLSAVLALVLALPHLIWLVQSDFAPVAYALDQKEAASLAGRVFHSLRFLAAQLLDHAPLFIVAALATVKPWRGAAPEPLLVPLARQDAFDRVYVAWVALAPALLAALLSLILGIQFRTLWGAPMFAFSGLGLLLIAGPALAVRRPRLCAALLTAYLLAIPVLHTAGLWLSPWINHKSHRPIWPAEAIAAGVSAAWSRETGKPLSIVAGEPWLAGLIGLYGPDRASVMAESSFALNPWIDAEALKTKGAAIVWQIRDPARPAMPAAYRLEGFAAEPRPPLAFTWPLGLPIEPVTVGWAIVAPRPE